MIGMDLQQTNEIDEFQTAKEGMFDRALTMVSGIGLETLGGSLQSLQKVWLGSRRRSRTKGFGRLAARDEAAAPEDWAEEQFADEGSKKLGHPRSASRPLQHPAVDLIGEGNMLGDLSGRPFIRYPRRGPVARRYCPRCREEALHSPVVTIERGVKIHMPSE